MKLNLFRRVKASEEKKSEDEEPRNQMLPQLGGKELFITDSGLETTLIFKNGIDIPEFASFTLMEDPKTLKLLDDYFRLHIELAQKHNCGIVLESVNWRSNPDWGEKLNYSSEGLAAANRNGVQMLDDLRREYYAKGFANHIVVSGCIGPRGDGYVVDCAMTAQEAKEYHSAQINVFASTPADVVSAYTLNYVEEGLGIALAAKEADVPVVLSFTLETNGCLPSGQTLEAAIDQIDHETASYPAYYMINCVHPIHFQDMIRKGGKYLDRIYGVRANASKMSHEELDQAEELDEGNPEELGQSYIDLKKYMKNMCVVGGCCGTNEHHVEQIALACIPIVSKDP